MACERVKLPGGGTAIVRFTGRRRCHKCSIPGCTNNAGYQCDGKRTLHSGTKQTCNAWICEQHRTPAGNDVDFCPRHAKGMQLSLGL